MTDNNIYEDASRVNHSFDPFTYSQKDALNTSNSSEYELKSSPKEMETNDTPLRPWGPSPQPMPQTPQLRALPPQPMAPPPRPMSLSQAPTQAPPPPPPKEVPNLPYTLNSITCQFDEVFMEPNKPLVPAGVRNFYRKMYSTLHMGAYLLLSFIIGPILLIIYGILLAISSFFIGWVLHPFIHCIKMCFSSWEGLYSSYLNCCMAPLFKVMGTCCSRVVIRYQQVPSQQAVHV